MQPIEITNSIYDKANEEKLIFKAQPGLNENLVRQISKDKNEPEWMLQKRLSALELFNQLDMPNFGPDLSDLDINDISLFLKPKSVKNAKSWNDIPQDIKDTYERLGIPKAERESLG